MLSAPHSLFSFWTDLKRSVKILGAPTWRRGEWIWLPRSSGLHRNSPQGLNINSIRVFDQIRDPEIPITLRSLLYNNFNHSPTFLLLHLRHNSFSNPSVALRTSQFILLPFRCFTYVTVFSSTLLSLLLRHKLFTYVTHVAVSIMRYWILKSWIDSMN